MNMQLTSIGSYAQGQVVTVRFVRCGVCMNCEALYSEQLTTRRFQSALKKLGWTRSGIYGWQCPGHRVEA